MSVREKSEAAAASPREMPQNSGVRSPRSLAASGSAGWLLRVLIGMAADVD